MHRNILHVEYHRPRDKGTPKRYSRHYADTAALAHHAAGIAALNQQDLMKRVVAWKQLFFRSGWARYDLAVPGTFKLAPHQSRLAELQSDYQDMNDMYLTTPPTFDSIVETLRTLEDSINTAK